MKKGKSAMKKMVSLTLSFVLVAAIVMSLPQASIQVQAAPDVKDVNLGTGGIENPNNTGDDTTLWTGSKVYFGGQECFVLDKDGNRGKSSLSGHMLLLTAEKISDQKFDDSTSDWSGSTIRSYLNGNGFYDTLTATEQNSITAFSIGTTNTYGGSTTFPTGSTDKIFLLDHNDVFEHQNYGFVSNESRKISSSSGSNWWWLRSSDLVDDAVCVVSHGNGNFYRVDNALGVRPAFNLNLSSVLFTSAAAGGKSDFAEVGTNPTNEWKLTLSDGDTNFATDTLPSEGKAGEDITVNVTAVAGGTHNQTSAMLVDGSNQVVAYGKIGDTTTGDKTFTIPATIPTGTYTLKVFQEQVNGDKKTDYAGNVVEGSITICNHANTKTIESEPATCSKFGVKEYYQCADCKKYFSDSACISEITDLGTWKAGAGKLEKTTTHTPATAYSHNDTEHWQTCTVCNTELTHYAHQESDTYSHDNTAHWKTCTVCGVALNSTKHDIGTNGKCTDCGYDSTCTHTYGTGVANGATGHKKTCSKCSDVITEAHISGGSATATSPEVCKACGYEISPALGGGTSGGGGGTSGGGSTPSGGANTQVSQEEIDRPNPFVNYLQTTTGQIASAKEGATITIDFGDFNVLTLPVMKQMAMRRDLTIQMKYRYKGQKFEVTFPAGMPIKYQDDIRYYGPLKLADMANRDGGACKITD